MTFAHGAASISVPSLILAGGLLIVVGRDCRAQDTSALRIGSITVNRKEIFDPGDSTERHWFGTIINSLHFLTKEHIIRNELLFRRGDLYDSGLVEESERNLRKKSIIGDISIRSLRVDSSTTDITVETRDKWTLNPNASYNNDGGIQIYGLALSDDNFLGNAQHLSLSYNHNSDRRNPHGMETRFVEPRLFGSLWSMTLEYKNSDDSRIRIFHLEYPFYTEQTRWTGGVHADDGGVRFRRFDNDLVTQEDFLPQAHYSGWLAFSTGEQTKLRIGAAFSRVTTLGDSSSLSTIDNIDLASISLGVFRRTWYKAQFLNNFGRVEDVSLGYTANIVAGKNLFPAKNGPESFLHLSAQIAAGDERQFYVGSEIVASSYFRGTQASDAILAWNTVQYLKLTPMNTLVSNLHFVYGWNSSPASQLVLGSPNGLRGYPAHQLSGQRELLLNIEDRIFPDLHIWFFRLGAAAFFDCAGVCGDQGDILRQKFYAGAGFGIRIENEKEQGMGIIRIDIAANLDSGQLGLLTISTNQLFGAFSTIELPLVNVSR